MHPDLLLLDLSLPEGDGFEIVEWFKEHDRLRDAAVLVYTGRDLTNNERVLGSVDRVVPAA
jgi:DNA-binding response OmpR family regulator